LNFNLKGAHVSVNEVTVFIEETAVTLPLHTQVAHAVRAYLARRDPDLIKLIERNEICAVDAVGHEVQENSSLEQGMRLYIKKVSRDPVSG
jgi:hypothetical protein